MSKLLKFVFTLMTQHLERKQLNYFKMLIYLLFLLLGVYKNSFFFLLKLLQIYYRLLLIRDKKKKFLSFLILFY